MNWSITQSGCHKHPAPFPLRATRESREQLRQILMVDPDLTVTDLQHGNNIRKPIRNLDIKFTSPDYLSCILQQERRNVYNSVRGYSKAHDA